MSTNSMVVGMMRLGLTMAARASRRGSGIGTMPLFGSMVQKGKFSAAIPDLVKALNRVDLPTFGRPTMPQLNPMVLPSSKSQAFWLCRVFIARFHSPAKISGSTPRAKSILASSLSCSARGARPSTKLDT